jgi:hypothetical protein
LSRDFDPDVAEGIAIIEGKDLSRFSTDDDFGSFIETPFQPAGQKVDPTRGVHAYLHDRFSHLPRGRYGDMMNFRSNIFNQRFWKLHGWIDAQWTVFRKSKNLSDTDPDYCKAIADQTKMMNMSKDHMMSTTEPMCGPTVPDQPRDSATGALMSGSMK